MTFNGRLLEPKVASYLSATTQDPTPTHLQGLVDVQLSFLEGIVSSPWLLELYDTSSAGTLVINIVNGRSEAIARPGRTYVRVQGVVVH